MMEEQDDFAVSGADKERLWRAIDEVSTEASWGREDSNDLRRVIGSAAMTKALGMLYAEAKALPNRMLTLDYSAPTALLEATRLQAQAVAQIRCLDRLLGLAFDGGGEDGR